MIKKILFGMLLFCTPAFAQTPSKPCPSIETTMKQLDEKGFKIAFSGIVSTEKKIWVSIFTNGPLFIEFAVADGTMCPMVNGSGYYIQMKKDRSQAE